MDTKPRYQLETDAERLLSQDHFEGALSRAESMLTTLRSLRSDRTLLMKARERRIKAEADGESDHEIVKLAIQEDVLAVRFDERLSDLHGRMTGFCEGMTLAFGPELFDTWAGFD